MKSTTDLLHCVSVWSCRKWLLVNAAHHPYVSNNFPVYGLNPNLFDCVERYVERIQLWMGPQVKAVPGHT